MTHTHTVTGAGVGARALARWLPMPPPLYIGRPAVPDGAAQYWRRPSLTAGMVRESDRGQSRLFPQGGVPGLRGAGHRAHDAGARSVSRARARESKRITALTARWISPSVGPDLEPARDWQTVPTWRRASDFVLAAAKWAARGAGRGRLVSDTSREEAFGAAHASIAAALGHRPEIELARMGISCGEYEVQRDGSAVYRLVRHPGQVGPSAPDGNGKLRPPLAPWYRAAASAAVSALSSDLESGFTGVAKGRREAAASIVATVCGGCGDGWQTPLSVEDGGAVVPRSTVIGSVDRPDPGQYMPRGYVSRTALACAVGRAIRSARGRALASCRPQDASKARERFRRLGRVLVNVSLGSGLRAECEAVGWAWSEGGHHDYCQALECAIRASGLAASLPSACSPALRRRSLPAGRDGLSRLAEWMALLRSAIAMSVRPGRDVSEMVLVETPAGGVWCRRQTLVDRPGVVLRGAFRV